MYVLLLALIQAETETRYIFICETCPIMSDDTCLMSLSTVQDVA